ncbi:MAG: ATP-binding protein [bacterium]|jgi:two-component system phosphate regulon sensor histidine kinase PhoR|nr:ATP-binding protein [Bacillota bacterium]HHW55732.1 cell wall metabolism sensor histidine kinase WalK [Bacillota bacterium]
MFRSIKWRLTLTYFILILLSLAIMGTFLLHAMEGYHIREIEENLMAHARVFSHYAQLTFLGNDLAQQFGQDVDARVQILDDGGRVVGDSLWPDVAIGEVLDRPGVREALAGEMVSSRQRDETGGERLLCVAAPLRSGNEIIGAVYLTSSLARVDRTLGVIRNFLIFGISLALGVSLLVGFYLAGTVTGPIGEITRAAQEVARGQYDWQIKLRGRDEVAQLAETFNYLTGRLKETIAAISGERKKLAAVLTSMGDGLVAVDDQGQVILLNPAAEKMFGVQAEAVIGFPLWERINHPRLWQLFQEVLKGGEPLVDELETPQAPGALYRVQVSPVWGDKGEIAGAVAVLRDISDLRRLEQMRLQFLSNVSHELRTPLTSIKGFAVTLADELPPGIPAQRYVEVIEKETDRLARLVDDLLTLSRMDALEVTMELVSLQPEKLITGCVTQLLPRAQRAGIELKTEIKQELPRILCDPDRMKQVLINLLDNALKFTPRGGTVTVQAWADQEHLCLAVRDTGIGIPAQDLPHIFDRFYRVDKARSRALGGTGLGLSIVKWLVEQHAGIITVASTPGEGTEFVIRLPYRGIG